MKIYLSSQGLYNTDISIVLLSICVSSTLLEMLNNVENNVKVKYLQTKIKFQVFVL